MYPKLIFYVDYTLYNSKDIPKEESETEDITENFYTLFVPKVKLIKLLQEYKGEIYLFSNGNLCHIQEVIDKTNLSSIFKKEHIATLDNYLDKPKPYVKAYKYVITTFNIKDDDIVYFFEDNLDNLKVAKHKYNWNTIFIDEEKTTNKKTSHHSYVDYTFKDVTTSLRFIIPKLHKKYGQEQRIEHKNNDSLLPINSNNKSNKNNKNKSKKNKNKKNKTRRSPFKHRKNKKLRKSKNNGSIIKQNRLHRLERLQEDNN